MLDQVKFCKELGATKIADTLIALDLDGDQASKKALWQMFMRARHLQYSLKEPLDEPTKTSIAYLEKHVGQHSQLARVVIDDFEHLVEQGTYTSYGKNMPFSQPYMEMADMMRTMLARTAAQAALAACFSGL